MKKITSIVLLVFVFLSLQGCEAVYKIRNVFRFGEKTEFSYGVTALQWYPYIEKRAQQWKPDARLYGIAETKVTIDGVSDKWDFLFYSPGSEKTALIIYEAGFISCKEVVMPPLKQIKQFDIDSPTALNIANRNNGNSFIENNKNLSIIISLSGAETNNKGNNASWNIRYYGDEETFSINIDAQTGKIIK